MEDLSQTVALMCSADYKERFQAEFFQLNTRYLKLKKMVQNWDEGKLNFTPTCPRETYDLQLRTMADYRAVLLMRAKIENIDLSLTNA